MSPSKRHSLGTTGCLGTASSEWSGTCKRRERAELSTQGCLHSSPSAFQEQHQVRGLAGEGRPSHPPCTLRQRRDVLLTSMDPPLQRKHPSCGWNSSCFQTCRSSVSPGEHNVEQVGRAAGWKSGQRPETRGSNTCSACLTLP